VQGVKKVITRDELILKIKERGYNVSVYTLQRWSREGLITTPKIKQLGQGKGAVTIFPNDIEKQILFICKSLKKKNDLINARWELWVKGFSVDPLPVLNKSLDALRDFQNEIIDDSGLLKDDLYNWVEKSDKERFDFFLSKARKRLGKKRFSGFLLLLFEIHTPPTFIKDEDEQNIFDDGLSYFFEKTFNENVYSVIERIRPHFNHANLEEILSDITDKELRKGYAEIIELLAFSWSVFTFLKITFEGKKPTRRGLNDIKKDIPLILLVWLSMRKDQVIYNAYKTIKRSIEKMLSEMEK
jgi:hypothetical protein